MGPNPQETADMVPFTKEILNGNFIFVQCKHGCLLISEDSK